jgi:hypothetical protein
MSTNPFLKAFVRYDASDRPVAGSLILRLRKPKIGKWREVQTHNILPTTTTTSSTSTTTSTSTSTSSTTTTSTTIAPTTTTTTTV